MSWTETPAGGMARLHGAGRIVIHRHERVLGKWEATEWPRGWIITPAHAEHLPHGIERARSGWGSIEQAMAEIDERFPKPPKLRAKLRMMVEADIEWKEGQPDTATIGPIGSTDRPAQVLAAGASEPCKAVRVDLPPVTLPQGWWVVLMPVAGEGAREIERLRGGG